jgi:hypothetical protein
LSYRKRPSADQRTAGPRARRSRLVSRPHAVASAVLLGCLLPVMGTAQTATTDRRRDSATLSISALTGVDDSRDVSGSAAGVDQEFRDRQAYSALSADLLLHSQSRRVQWNLDGGTGVRYYESLHEADPTGQHVDASFSFSLGPRTTVGLSEWVLYAPAYQPGYSATPFAAGSTEAADLSPSALDYGLVRTSYLGTSSTISLVRTLSRRSSVSFSYAASRMAFSDAANPDLDSSNASARYTYRLTRYSSFHAGYVRRLGRYSLADDVRENHVDDYDLGIDYSRPLSLTSTRTTLTFGTGSSAYDDFGGRHYAVTGTATLAHRFGRKDHASLGYSRGLGFVEGLVTPLFTDTVTGDLGMSLSPRVRLSSTFNQMFGRTVGDETLLTTGNGYDATSANAQLSFVLGRRVALQTGYRYYEYSVGDSVRLLGQLPGHQRRQTLFAGIVVGLPLMTDPARPRR